MKTITIQVPDDCEIQIVRKEEKQEPVIRTYQDLIDNGIRIEGWCINYYSKLQPELTVLATGDRKNIASSRKVAKSMLAMAMISQLMPYYGGAITDEEWRNTTSNKFTIERDCSESNQIKYDTHQFMYYFLAFHTEEQRDEFLKYNERLVKDYLMID